MTKTGHSLVHVKHALVPDNGTLIRSRLLAG